AEVTVGAGMGVDARFTGERAAPCAIPVAAGIAAPPIGTAPPAEIGGAAEAAVDAEASADGTGHGGVAPTTRVAPAPGAAATGAPGVADPAARPSAGDGSAANPTFGARTRMW